MVHFENGTLVEVTKEYFERVDKPYEVIKGQVVETKRELVTIRKICCGSILSFHQTWFKRLDKVCLVCNSYVGVMRDRRKSDRRKN